MGESVTQLPSVQLAILDFCALEETVGGDMTPCLLLEAVADKNAVDGWWTTALKAAAYLGHLEVLSVVVALELRRMLQWHVLLHEMAIWKLQLLNPIAVHHRTKERTMFAT